MERRLKCRDCKWLKKSFFREGKFWCMLAVAYLKPGHWVCGGFRARSNKGDRDVQPTAL